MGKEKKKKKYQNCRKKKIKEKLKKMDPES